MLCGSSTSRVTVSALAGGENALAKARRAPQHFADTRDFDNIDADGNDHK